MGGGGGGVCVCVWGGGSTASGYVLYRSHSGL